MAKEVRVFKSLEIRRKEAIAEGRKVKFTQVIRPNMELTPAIGRKNAEVVDVDYFIRKQERRHSRFQKMKAGNELAALESSAAAEGSNESQIQPVE